MKALKWIVAIVVVISLILGIALAVMHEPAPTHEPSPEAEALADKVLAAINKPAWDSLQGLKWTFPGDHHYEWNKQANTAIIKWSDNEVNMNLNDQSGTGMKAGKAVDGNELQKLLDKAWGFWCNDSFWMFAPYKLRDPNTSRSIVMQDGKQALMVSYDGGGVTPGDKYLWLLDDNYRPTAYKMWVSIIPIGGVEFSWEDWVMLPSGATVATTHVSNIFTLNMTSVEELTF